MEQDLHRKTKIVCTIGTASGSPRIVEKLVRAGMNVARINLSHGNKEKHSSYINTVRTVSDKLGVPVAVLVDLPGPRYRTGLLKDGQVDLKKGALFVLTTRSVPGDRNEVSLNMPNLVKDVASGSKILVDDGAIHLKVRSATDTDIACTVMADCVLRPRKGIAAPGVKLSAPLITEDMRQHIEFAVEHQVEYVALSYVSQADDVSQVKTIMANRGLRAALIAKIEREEAVRNFDTILKVSDGVMVARGDLGVEIPLERVPLVQKEIIRRCNHDGKPVITATQMLQSMTDASRPTRAEVADVANAIWDGSDAIMLSSETSIGRYPVEAVTMMSRIAKETETALPYERMMAENGNHLEPQTDDAIAYDACHTAHQVGAQVILAFSESGSTAWRVCKYRPKAPIVAMTPHESVRRRLVLAWGVYPYLMSSSSQIDDLFERGSDLAQQLRLAKKGDRVVITGGVPVGVAGTTNMLKVQCV
ncbi:MAG: pyruvate kinase [Chloroflexota bacterium]|nr:pyruvate kinase [Chloroflexota bacterium]